MASSDELYENPVHPYTKSLLSAIPLPDPDYERTRVRKIYDPSQHQYGPEDKVQLREVAPNHLVLCSEREFEQYKKEYEKK